MSVTAEVAAALEGRETGPLGAIAMELARRLDDPDSSQPHSVSKELTRVLEEIDLIPGEVADPLAEARAARAARRAGEVA